MSSSSTTAVSHNGPECTKAKISAGVHSLPERSLCVCADNKQVINLMAVTALQLVAFLGGGGVSHLQLFTL